MIYDKLLEDKSLFEAVRKVLEDPLIQKRYRIDSSEVENISSQEELKSLLERSKPFDKPFERVVDPDFPVTSIAQSGASALGLLQHPTWQKEWGELFEAKAGLLASFSKSVGCIKLKRGASSAPEKIGTGWVVQKNVIATNWHVVESQLMLLNGKPVFKPTDSGETVELSINFSNIWNSASLEFKIDKVLFLPEGSTVILNRQLEKDDLALLQVESLSTRSEPLPEPLPVSKSFPAIGQTPSDSQHSACAIGFLSREDDVEWSKIKPFVVDKGEDKWLSLGRIQTDADGNGVFQHKCNTTRGNSGSPVISLELDSVVGVHFDFDRNVEEGNNLAVSSVRLLEILSDLGLL